MTNIISAGGVGACTALLLTTSGIVPLLGWTTRTLRTVVQSPPSSLLEHLPLPQLPSPWDGTNGLGFVLGCVFVYGSKVGWYHTVFLPVVLIEMEHGDASLWGSIDVCALVMVSAGVCAGNLLLPPSTVQTMMRQVDDTTSTATATDTDTEDNDDDAVKSISRRGLITNLLFGDFIEAAYPSMERSTAINLAAYLGGGIATELLLAASGGSRSVASSAYLPILVSVVVADDRGRMVLAVVCAFGVPLVGTIGGNLFGRWGWWWRRGGKCKRG